MFICPKKTGAFTLIEMLVVIAIIGIIASMLLPSLRGAMDSARNISCQNNLKNLALWGYSYAEDWGGILPTGYNETYTAGHLSETTWFDKNPDYLMTNKTEALRCTLRRQTFQSGWHENLPDYSINQHLCVEGYFAKGRPPRSSDLNSSVFWWGDGTLCIDGPGSGLWYVNSVMRMLKSNLYVTGVYSCPWPWSETYIEKGHLKGNGCGANIIFGDAHIEQMDYRDVLDMDNTEFKSFQKGIK